MDSECVDLLLDHMGSYSARSGGDGRESCEFTLLMPTDDWDRTRVQDALVALVRDGVVTYHIHTEGDWGPYSHSTRRIDVASEHPEFVWRAHELIKDEGLKWRRREAMLEAAKARRQAELALADRQAEYRDAALF